MNDSPFSPDDEKLTAYALGELDEAERAEVEAAVQRDPALATVVAEIRATASQLETALTHEPAPAVSPIALPHAPQPRGKLLRFPVVYYVISGAAAAGFAFMVALHEPPAKQRMMEERMYVPVTLPPTETSSVQMPALALQQERDQAAAPSREDLALAPSSDVAVSVAPKGTVTTVLSSTGNEAQTADGRVTENLSLLAQSQSAPIDGLKAVHGASSPENVTFGSNPPAAVVPSPPPPQIGDVRVSAAAPKGELSRSRAASAEPTPAAAAGAAKSPEGETVTLSAFSVSSERDANIAGIAESRMKLDIGARNTFAPIVISSGRVSSASEMNTESYGFRRDNEFIFVANEPLSTFSIDVDTASYANVRRFLRSGQLPPRDAVRVEELINYFPYRYTPPANNAPFAATLEVAAAPWEPKHRLVRIGLKGREMSQTSRPAANLVFLVDVSGSMNQPNKLPLVKDSLRLLVGKLREDDRVALVTYAGNSGLALPSTPASKSTEILAAIDRLESGGSTNGGMGIHLAYDIAKANFITGGVNRVLLCTDGDFNVGVTNEGDLVRLVQEKAKSNVFLTVLGYGMGNLKDSTLEQIANRGNGAYAYIDSKREAEKTLVEQAGGTLVTIAKDVKIQVEFNPAQVSAYRLVGYENRLLKKEEFNNDKVDAGEIGAGHTVTALYEVVPAGVEQTIERAPAVDELRYRTPEAGNRNARASASAANPISKELLVVKVRYKEPTGDVSEKLEFPLSDSGAAFEAASSDFKFAASVAGFGLALRSETPSRGLIENVRRWAEAGAADDPGGYRAEFLGLVRSVEGLVR